MFRATSLRKHSKLQSEAPSYIGVSWHKKDKRWRVKIARGKRHFFLGNYKDAEYAARVYDYAARISKGPDAVLNFDGSLPPDTTHAGMLNMLAKAGFLGPEYPVNFMPHPTTSLTAPGFGG